MIADQSDNLESAYDNLTGVVNIANTETFNINNSNYPDGNFMFRLDSNGEEILINAQDVSVFSQQIDTSFATAIFIVLDENDNTTNLIPDFPSLSDTIGLGINDFDTTLFRIFATESAQSLQRYLAIDGSVTTFSATVVPIPPAFFLFGSALVGLGIFRTKQK